MSGELALTEKETAGLLPSISFTQEQVKLIKDTVAKGTDDNEFALFLYTAKHTGLNPLLRQIHAVKRWDSKLEREAMAIQTGIDGYRLIAERTRRYAPGREATFTYGQNGEVVSATAYIKKLTSDGTWHDVSETAFYNEYVQLKKDGKPNSMWDKMPHSQLAKCAEAKALRRAFPMETGGVKIEEEMGQAENTEQSAQLPKPQRKSESTDPKTGSQVVFIPAAVETKTGEKNGKPWTKWGIKDQDGNWYSTFDEALAAVAEEARSSKKFVILSFVIEGKYKTVKDVQIKEQGGA